MANQHDGMSESLTAPADDAVAITPSDSVDLPYISRSIYVGGAGDVVLITKNGQEVTFSGHPVGYIPVRALRVKATGTTATNLVNLY